MIEIYDNDSDDLVGEITEAQLRFLIEEMEETAESNRDFYLHEPTLLLLEEAGADEELIEVLQDALGDRDGVEIRWEERVEDDD